MSAINAAYNLRTGYHRMSQTSTEPRAPPPSWVYNVSCYHPYLESHSEYLIDNPILVEEIVRSFLLALITILITSINLGFLVVLNSKSFKKVISGGSRYLLTGLAVTDLLTGILITATGIYPALFECWPYGHTLCQIQALLRGALRQIEALLLIFLALERYTSSVHHEKAILLCSKKMCLAYIFLSLLMSVSFYGIIVFSKHGFHFSVSSFSICEPYYVSHRLLVLTSCLFYFPTTMVLMYMYGSIFHSHKLKISKLNAMKRTATTLETNFQENVQNEDVLVRCFAAMSLCFIIVVTPWSILQVITSVTMEDPPAIVDFTVSYLATSQCFLGPIIFWILNPKFRKNAANSYKKFCCGMTRNALENSELASNFTEDQNVHPDIVGEKFWGEILERTMSQNNLIIRRGLMQQQQLQHTCHRSFNQLTHLSPGHLHVPLSKMSVSADNVSCREGDATASESVTRHFVAGNGAVCNGTYDNRLL